MPVHNNPDILDRFLLDFADEDFYFLLHLDKKSVTCDFEKFKNYPNVWFLKERIEVFWGDFSEVQVTINLMKFAQNIGVEFSHFILYFGSSTYPLQHKSYIKHFFSKHSQDNFLNITKMPNKKVNKELERLERFYFKNRGNLGRKFSYLLAKVWQRNYKKHLNNRILFAGSAHFAFTKDLINYILNVVENEADFVKTFHLTDCPDECFFHTIVGNSPYYGGLKGSLTYNCWLPNHVQNLITEEAISQYLLSYNKNNEPVFFDNSSEYKKQELLFVRKFSSSNAQLIDKIKQQKVMGTD